jgi:hypothetical protein
VRLRSRETGEELEVAIVAGLDDPATEPGRALFGVDGWQALSHALLIAKSMMQAAAASHELFWFDGTPLDPDQHL